MDFITDCETCEKTNVVLFQLVKFLYHLVEGFRLVGHLLLPSKESIAVLPYLVNHVSSFLRLLLTGFGHLLHTAGRHLTHHTIHNLRLRIAVFLLHIGQVTIVSEKIGNGLNSEVMRRIFVSFYCSNLILVKFIQKMVLFLRR